MGSQGFSMAEPTVISSIEASLSSSDELGHCPADRCVL